MGDWQPISTAPKDWRRVRLLIPYDRDIFTEEECTDEGYWDASEIRYDDEDINCENGCWRFDGDDGPFDLQPTHWQPIPPHQSKNDG